MPILRHQQHSELVHCLLVILRYLTRKARHRDADLETPATQ
uniref:Uncharacterized protein n=1 Tax=Parascaris univalens TaxID=6257 RepID=A0A915CKF8_PARUN